MNLSPSEAFATMLQANVARRMAELRGSIERAVMLGQPLDTLRAEYLATEEIAAGIVWPPEGASEAAAIAALVPQWPAAFPPLPLWFTDPAAAAALDPVGEKAP